LINGSGYVESQLVTAIARDHPHRPLAGALRAFIDKHDIHQEAEVRLSLPAQPNVDGSYQFDNLADVWSFHVSDLVEALDGRTVRIWNDAAASFWGIYPLIYGDNAKKFREELNIARAVEKGRFILLSPGTGLGAVIGYYTGSKLDQWRYIPSEVGAMHITWTGVLASVAQSIGNDLGKLGVHKRVLRQMGLAGKVFNRARFNHREFFLSGPGITRIYYQLQGWKVAEIGMIATAVQKAEEIAALAHLGSDDTAVQTMRLFCQALGQTMADMCTFATARSGVFLTGSLLCGIGSRKLFEFGLIDAFRERLRDSHAEYEIPVFLINHPYTELIGLSRHKRLNRYQRLRL
jgi:glucokinase